MFATLIVLSIGMQESLPPSEAQIERAIKAGTDALIRACRPEPPGDIPVNDGMGFDFNALMFENQPEELTAGLSNTEIKALAAEAGASSAVDQCIDDARFKGWVEDATNRALTQPIPNSDLDSITGTPTVLVNGNQYVGSLEDPAEFSAFVLQAAGASYSESGTPTPTPTPTPEG